MALILGIYDPDNDRRAQIMGRLPGSLSGLTHLIRGEASLGGLDIFWEASPSTPVSVARDHLAGRDRLALVVGDFDAPYSVRSDAAQRLLRRTASQTPDLGCISGQDGYYLAMLFDQRPSLVLGTDVLGLFPLYYWIKGAVCLFGTSPELFKLHPLFVAEPDIYAVASVLLINHISGGHSLFKGVRRNRPAHYVERKPDGTVCETKANPILMSEASFDMPYQSCLERVASCFDAFHAPLRSLPELDIFLSGGQDSRMVAGYVDKHLLRKTVRAVSLGCRDDQELQYARKVSRVFGWPHHYRDVEFEKHVSFATRQLHLESLQGPFASFDIGTVQPLLAESGGPVICGYLGDLVIGDRHILAGRSQKSGEFDFDTLFRALNGYGFKASDVVELLSAHDGQSTVDQVIDDLRGEWSGIEGLPFQKNWLFQMTHRQRYHVGSLIWRLSLGAWPLLPYYHRGFLDVITSMPLHYLGGRRMQADIIKRQFPRLATLPLDRNAVGADYLVTPLYRKFLPPISEVSWRLYKFLERGRERRYYHRTYDYNGPGWRSVRREAERYRRQARDLLHPDALSRLLPAADAHVDFENGVVETSKTKTLLGLVLWNGMNFGDTPKEDAVSV